MPQLVQLPLKVAVVIVNKNDSVNSLSYRPKKSFNYSRFAGHRPEQKSWEFLTEYINNSQNRHDLMKAKIAEAVTFAKNLEEAASLERAAKLKKEELENLEQQKIAKESEARKAAEENIYERPQAKSVAEAFLDATKEIFSMSSAFENSQDSMAKNFRMKLKMAINKRTGQITDSLKQIRAVVGELVQLCFESRTISKQAFSYCLTLLSNKLLAQAESQVSLHAPSAFPLALVAVEISTNVVEFPSVLMSALIKRCCFAVPRYPKKTSTSEAYKIELGYLVVDGVVKESDTAFFERMSGLISFYGAIVQTNSLSGKPNVIGHNMGWTWLATILNLPPRPVTAYLLLAFLEQASFAFYWKYGVNFEKMIKLILEKYIVLIPNSNIASKTRLEILCKEIISSGQHHIKEPTGLKLAP